MAQLSQKRLFLLDMDGTIYLSDRLFDRVPEFLARVRGSGGRGERTVCHVAGKAPGSLPGGGLCVGHAAPAGADALGI